MILFKKAKFWFQIFYSISDVIRIFILFWQVLNTYLHTSFYCQLGIIDVIEFKHNLRFQLVKFSKSSIFAFQIIIEFFSDQFHLSVDHTFLEFIKIHHWGFFHSGQLLIHIYTKIFNKFSFQNTFSLLREKYFLHNYKLSSRLCWINLYSPY